MAEYRTSRLRQEPLRKEHAALVLDPLQDLLIYRFIPDDPPTADALQKRYAFLEGARSPDGRELWLNWIAFLHDGTARRHHSGNASQRWIGNIRVSCFSSFLADGIWARNGIEYRVGTFQRTLDPIVICGYRYPKYWLH